MGRPRVNSFYEGQSFGPYTVTGRTTEEVVPGARYTRLRYELRCRGCGVLIWKRCDRVARSRFCRGCAGCRMDGAKWSKTTESRRLVKARVQWRAMIYRCRDTSHKSYSCYGGRGIKVCDRWAASFDNFTSDMGQRPPGMTLGRIDNDGDYCPENCRWETVYQQCRNKRSTRWARAFGETKSAAEWGEDPRCAVTASGLRQRIIKGWNPQVAITAPRYARIKSLSKPHAPTPAKGKT